MTTYSSTLGNSGTVPGQVVDRYERYFLFILYVTHVLQLSSDLTSVDPLSGLPVASNDLVATTMEEMSWQVPLYC